MQNSDGHWAIAYHSDTPSNPRGRKWYYVARVVQVDGKWWELYRWGARPGRPGDPGGAGGIVVTSSNNRKATREAALDAGLGLLHGLFTSAPAPRVGPELVRQLDGGAAQ